MNENKAEGKKFFTFANSPAECRPSSACEYLGKELGSDVEKLAGEVTEKLGIIVKSILLFGSIVDPRRRTDAYDVDIAFVIDDLKHITDSDRFQSVIQQKVERMSKSINPRFHPTVIRLSKFWEGITKSSPFTINVLSSCVVIYDLGFVEPLRPLVSSSLMNKDKIVKRALESANATLHKVEMVPLETFMRILEPLLVELSQAALIEFGTHTPPSPADIPQAIRAIFRDKLPFMTDEDCRLIEDFVNLYKRFESDSPVRLTYNDLDQYLSDAKRYARKIQGVIKKRRTLQQRQNAEIKAEELLNQAKVTADPNLRSKIGELMLIAGKSQEALRQFDLALEIDPQNEKAWFLKIKALHEIKKFGNGSDCCNSALENIPEKSKIRSTILLLKGRALIEKGLKEKAFSSLDLIKESDDHFFEALRMKARVLKEQSDFKRALKLFERLMASKPDDTSLINEYINLLYLTEKLNKCQKVTKEHGIVGKRARRISLGYFETDEELASAWNDLAMTYIWIRDYESAVEAAEKAMKLYRRPENLDSLGVALMHTGRLDEAMLVFDECLASGPHNPNFAEHKRNRERCAKLRREKGLSSAKKER